MKKKLGLSLLLMAVAIPVAVAGGGGPGKGEKKDDGPLQGKQVQAPLMAAPAAAPTSDADFFADPGVDISLAKLIGSKAILRGIRTDGDRTAVFDALTETKIKHDDGKLLSQKATEATFIFGSRVVTLTVLSEEASTPYQFLREETEVQMPASDGWSTVVGYRLYRRLQESADYRLPLGSLFQQKEVVREETTSVDEGRYCVKEFDEFSQFKIKHRHQIERWEQVNRWTETLRRDLDGSNEHIHSATPKTVVPVKFLSSRDEPSCAQKK